MNICKEDYFFYEWLIMEKNIDKTTFQELTETEWYQLQCEYLAFEKTLYPKK